MLQEGSNELGGEVITNERVMCRMAYLVTPPSRYNHEGQRSSYSSILQLFENRYAQSLSLFCYTNAAQHVYFTTTLAGRPTGTVRHTPAISPSTTWSPRLLHFRGLEGEFGGGPLTQAI
ncbi:hypothetical protein ACN38_g9949 [Penicillium nordicum]|uniref:Uncharacterized protein n=1 Tax=Penicillium nordicum TaxID=229535 RepID=A0A0M8P2C0_9EURO|nr:hypothetical protein ACN38_g9949 [Penicillium nordicum]